MMDLDVHSAAFVEDRCGARVSRGELERTVRWGADSIPTGVGAVTTRTSGEDAMEIDLVEIALNGEPEGAVARGACEDVTWTMCGAVCIMGNPY